MEELIKALQIFAKYTDTKYPTHCEHDVLLVDVHPDLVSEQDKEELEKLGFIYKDDDGELIEEERFISYRFGSC